MTDLKSSKSHTEITNDSAIFQPLTKCDNEYSTIDVRANNLRGVPGLTKYLASIIKQQSNKNSCRRIGDRFNNDIRWEYEATTSGGNCKTSASESPGLTDAVQGFLNWMTDHNVDKACVKMNNCGTWRGILQIADHRKGISPGLCYDRFKG